MSSPETPVRRRVAVLLRHGVDVDRWRARHRAGETLDATPYGYERAAAWFDMTWARSHPERPVARKVRTVLANRLGFDIVHAWRNRVVLFDADIVWTHTESEHLAVCLLQRLWPRYRRTRLLAQTIWLWDRWDSLGRPRRLLYAWLLRTATVEATHSPVNLQTSLSRVPGRRVLLVPFGSQTLAARSAAVPESADVVAPGNDAHRDWETLAEAAAALPHLRFWVASSSPAAVSLDWPGNVTVERVSDADRYAQLLADAKVCIVSLKPNQHVSGMTTCIEASSVGTPLVVAGDGGLTTVLGPGPRFVAPGDPAALAEAIDEVVAQSRAGRRPDVPDIEGRGLTQQDYVTRYARITDMACGDVPWNDDVSALAPQSRVLTQRP